MERFFRSFFTPRLLFSSTSPSPGSKLRLSLGLDGLGSAQARTQTVVGVHNLNPLILKRRANIDRCLCTFSNPAKLETIGQIHSSTPIESKRSDPIKLSYESFQNENRAEKLPPLLLLHGMFGSRKNFRSIAKALSRTGRKILTVDLRNHGESPHTPHMDYEVMSEDVALLLHDLQLEEVHILGHSMGGKVAMMLALTKPELVSKLIVEDVSPRRSDGSVIIEEFVPALQGVKFDESLNLAKMRQAADTQLEANIPVFRDREFLLNGLIEEDGSFRWRYNVDAIKDNADSLMDFPITGLTFKGSSLFLAGKQSTHIRRADHNIIMGLFPNAHIHEMDAGHWIHSEKPLPFIDLVKQFLEEQ